MSSPQMRARMVRTEYSAKETALSWRVLKRVARYGRPYRKHFLAMLVSVVASAAAAVAPALLFQRIIDDGVIARRVDVVIWLSITLVLVAAVDAANRLWARWLSASIGEGVIFDLRCEVFNHIIELPIAFYARSNTGKLISRIQTDVIGAQQAFTSVLTSLMSNTLTLLFVLVAMLQISWQITLAALLLAPLYLIPSHWVGKRLAAATRRRMTANAELSAGITEQFSVAGAMLMKLFGRQSDVRDRYRERADEVRASGVHTAVLMRILFVALTLLAAIATAVAYGVGGWYAIFGSLTIGSLTALAALLARLYAPLTDLAGSHLDLVSAQASFERIFEVLDLPVRLTASEDPVPVPANPGIEFRDVSFSYDAPEAETLESLASTALSESARGEVLRDVSFTVEPGQMVALVGASGAGKTTITHLVSRFWDATSGTVLIGGVDVKALDDGSLRRVLGHITQDAYLFHDTIRENLRYADPSADDARFIEALNTAQLGDLLSRLPDGLDTVVGERGYRVSGGERQRFAIARLLLRNPEIVILDEATAHLDSESEAAVHRALDAVMANKTTLVIAHRLATVRRADQILVLDQGRIVERGTHQELLTLGGAYARLHEMQSWE